jgi:(carboxyethyl)arginine beta-lactam-synthase
VRRVTAVLDDAVRERLDSGPATVPLSGGLDSSSVAALARGAGAVVETISLGTDAGDEFAAARTVAEHLGTTHREFRVRGVDLLRQLPWAVAAAEITDAEVLEYLLPLVVLYRTLPGTGRRVLTGYGADIPLGGMHRATIRLDGLDQVIATDMQGFDGLNEMSSVLGGLAGHWTTHPFWDRAVLDVLVALEPGLKRRHGQDKWVLREAMSGMLPEATVTRPKLGIHEGSGATSVWTALLRDSGVAERDVPAAKNAMATAIHRLVVAQAQPPDAVSFDDVLREVTAKPTLAVTP